MKMRYDIKEFNIVKGNQDNWVPYRGKGVADRRLVTWEENCIGAC
jgi:hypothetical protein